MTCLSGAKTMESILASRLSSDLTVTPLEAPSKFCRAMSANFRMDGKQKRWDFVEAMPSVAVALVDTDLDALVVVRQFPYTPPCAGSREWRRERCPCRWGSRTSSVRGWWTRRA